MGVANIKDIGFAKLKVGKSYSLAGFDTEPDDFGIFSNCISKARFIGFVIYSVENDDYLFKLKELSQTSSAFWIHSPEKAQKFFSLEKAQFFVKLRPQKSLMVLPCFDVGDQVCVLTMQ